MNWDDQGAWDYLRGKAEGRLPDGFAHRVVESAGRRRHLRRVAARVALLSVLTLSLGLGAGSWWNEREVEAQQMVQWEEWQNFQLLSSL